MAALIVALPSALIFFFGEMTQLSSALLLELLLLFISSSDVGDAVSSSALILRLSVEMLGRLTDSEVNCAASFGELSWAVIIIAGKKLRCVVLCVRVYDFQAVAVR